MNRHDVLIQDTGEHYACREDHHLLQGMVLTCRAYPRGAVRLTVVGAMRQRVCAEEGGKPRERQAPRPEPAPAPAPPAKPAPAMPPSRPERWTSPEPQDAPHPVDPWARVGARAGAGG